MPVPTYDQFIEPILRYLAGTPTVPPQETLTKQRPQTLDLLTRISRSFCRVVFSLFGRILKPKVNTQWLLYCLVHNIGKIHRYAPDGINGIGGGIVSMPNTSPFGIYGYYKSMGASRFYAHTIQSYRLINRFFDGLVSRLKPWGTNEYD